MSADNYTKILQLLLHPDTSTVRTGIQLLQSTRDLQLMQQFLQPESELSHMLRFQLIPFFQQHPLLWKKLQLNLNTSVSKAIDQKLHLRILQLPDISIQAFCQLANEAVKNYHPSFPLLQADILQDFVDDGYSTKHWGSSTQADCCWTLAEEVEYLGPAETVEVKTWTALAEHPDFSIKLCSEAKECCVNRTWLEVLRQS